MSTTPTTRLSRMSYWILLGGFVLFWFSDTSADPDLWGHVRFGGDLLSAGTVHRPDVYSYLTAGQRWVNHEWLAELAMFGAFDVLGPGGLVLLKVIVVLAVFVLLYRELIISGLVSSKATVLLIIAAIPLLVGFYPARPQMFTILLFTMLLRELDRRDANSVRLLWTLPLMFLFWANLHGGFLAGVGVLCVWVIVEVIVGEEPMPRRLFPMVVLAVALLATLINPYGLDLWRFLVRTATVPRPEIIDWRPLAIASLKGVFYVVFLAGSAFILVREGRPRASMTIILAVLAIMPLLAVRHLPLFVVAVLVITAEPLARLGNAVPREEAPAHHPRVRSVASILMIGVGALLAFLSIPHFEGPRIVEFAGQPARAIDVLSRSRAVGNLVVPFDWGQYALWHLHPRLRVSIDGRRETVYPDSLYRQNLRFLFGRGDWDELIEDHVANIVLMPVGMPGANLMASRDGWVKVYQDSFSTIYTPIGSDALHKIRNTVPRDVPADGIGMVFP